ncbi:hypothetical protein C7B76_05055 [filamentous cyanobacterium CCP2]|nr:hypothetical protein C7B76_05055 [filamentous cyanobacterium CCP2]
MNRLTLAIFSTIALVSIAAPTMALSPRFEESREERLNALSPRFEDTHWQQLNALSPRFKQAYWDNLYS